MLRRRRSILRTMLFLATPQLSDDGPGVRVLEENTAVEVFALGEDGGLPVVPVFTSEEALGSWRPESPFIGLDGRAVLRLLVETPWSKIVVNPVKLRSIEITRTQAAKLLG